MTDVTVLSTAHDVADARLHRIVEALTAAGLTVGVEGLGGAGAAPRAAEVRTRARTGLLRRAWRAASLPAGGRPLRSAAGGGERHRRGRHLADGRS
jgi:hypothetical protein